MIPRLVFYACCLFVLSMVLSGCATRPPETILETVEVRVPVPVPCIAVVPTKPAFAVDHLPLGAGIDVQMRALRAERQQRIGYERELETSLKNCTARQNVD